MTNTSDAEAIAREALERLLTDAHRDDLPQAVRFNMKAVYDATLSLLASRRDAQEPVAWLRRPKGYKGGWVSVHTQSKPNDGDGIYEVLPVYNAPPAPASGALRTPDDCIDRMDCQLQRVRTEPDVGMTVCMKPGCPHAITAGACGIV